MKLFFSFLFYFAISVPALAANDRYRSGDLISVHWDSSYDYDDLQAMVATREVFDTFTGINYLAVNGAKSNTHGDILEGSSDVMRMVFPDGLDAYNDKSNSVQLAADKWQETLRSGGTVHVADGGPSDFTAEVVRVLESRGVSNLKNIQVVQHSQWNEDKTSSANLAYVKSATSYLKIQTGNGVNQTAWLRINADRTAEFRNLIAQSRYSHIWDTALQFATSADRIVDFSDAVEVLHILDVPKSQVADAFGFANFYFGKNESQPALLKVPAGSGIPVAAKIGNRVAVYGSNLSLAMKAYAAATSLRRVDCDPSGKGYICASFQNPTMADVQASPTPVGLSVPTPTPTPTTSAAKKPVITSGRVAVYGSNLNSAMKAFAAATSLRRVDCDRSGSGYICASFSNPTMADVTSVSAPTEPGKPVTPAAPTKPVTPVNSSNRVAVFGKNMSEAMRNYANATTLRRADCDPGAGGVICASFNNPTAADLGAGGTTSGSTPSTPVVVTPAAPPASTTANSIRFEVENYKLGAGWVKDTSRSGYSGSGFIRWAGENHYNIKQAGAGTMSFTVKPSSSGVYRVRLRARALSPAASDLNNDVWLRLDGTGWLKLYVAGKDSWFLGGAVDSGGKHYVLTKNLTAGKTYTLQISGRSNGMAIDYIELVKN